MADSENTRTVPEGAIARRRLLAGIAAAPVALAVPVLAAPTEDDAELFAAEAEIEAAYQRHLAECDTREVAGLPIVCPRFRETQNVMIAARERFATTPARTAKGLLLKIKHLVDEVEGGATAWGDELAAGTLADAQRLLGVDLMFGRA